MYKQTITACQVRTHYHLIVNFHEECPSFYYLCYMCTYVCVHSLSVSPNYVFTKLYCLARLLQCYIDRWFCLKVVSLILRWTFQMFEVGTNGPTTLRLKCTWIALENFNDNGQQLNRNDFQWQFIFWPTRLDRQYIRFHVSKFEYKVES